MFSAKKDGGSIPEEGEHSVSIVSSGVGVKEHDLILQYQSNGKLYYARWDLYGMIGSLTSSCEACFEKALLLDGVFHNMFLQKMCQEVLSLWLRAGRVFYDACFDKALPLKQKQIDQMFPKGRNWVFKVIHTPCDFVSEEVRFVLMRGVISGVPSDSKVKRYDLGTSTYFQKIAESKTQSFLTNLQSKSQKFLNKIERHFIEKNQTVIVSCVRPEGMRLVLWRTLGLKDANGQSVYDFLQAMVLQGTSESYLDETLRNFAFANASLIDCLQQTLAFDLQSGDRVFSQDGIPMLRVKDLKTIKGLQWVVSEDGIKRPNMVGSWALSVGCLVLEGIPQFRSKKDMSLLTTRNCLYALEWKNVVNGICPKMFWCYSQNTGAVRKGLSKWEKLRQVL